MFLLYFDIFYEIFTFVVIVGLEAIPIHDSSDLESSENTDYFAAFRFLFRIESIICLLAIFIIKFTSNFIKVSIRPVTRDMLHVTEYETAEMLSVITIICMVVSCLISFKIIDMKVSLPLSVLVFISMIIAFIIFNRQTTASFTIIYGLTYSVGVILHPFVKSIYTRAAKEEPNDGFLSSFAVIVNYLGKAFAGPFTLMFYNDDPDRFNFMMIVVFFIIGSLLLSIGFLFWKIPEDVKDPKLPGAMPEEVQPTANIKAKDKWIVLTGRIDILPVWPLKQEVLQSPLIQETGSLGYKSVCDVEHSTSTIMTIYSDDQL